jgi:hypothetical protein
MVSLMKLKALSSPLSGTGSSVKLKALICD